MATQLLKNYLVYPCKVMGISQSYTGIYSHKTNLTGSPCDYPIDEAGNDTGRTWMFCPCDGMRIARITGVGASNTNTLWLESTSQVVMPLGLNYITLMVVHPEDDDLSKLKTGQIFKRGEPICREGKDGRASGNHFHFSFGCGKMIGLGWRQNNLGAWVITSTGGPVKPEAACYLDTNLTKVIKTQGIVFPKLPVEK